MNTLIAILQWALSALCSIALCAGIIWAAYSYGLIPKPKPAVIFILCKPPGIPA
jgi:hypothetical protein